METLPAIPSDQVIPGLEDYDAAVDSKLPIIRIVSREGLFKDSLTGETFDKFTGVALAVVKNRVLWDPDLDENSKPLCKSRDFKHGMPGKDFPWRASGFSFDAYPEGSKLPCSDCPLQVWGSHPKNGKTPWCAEQHVFIVMREVSPGIWIPALLTATRTSVTPAKDYETGFFNERQPMFVVETHFGLEMKKKGSNDYSVLTLRRGDPTDESNFPEWIEKYRSIREFIMSGRGDDEEADPEVVDEPNVPAAAAPPTQPVAPPEQPVQQAPVAPVVPPQAQTAPQAAPQPVTQPQAAPVAPQAAPVHQPTQADDIQEAEVVEQPVQVAPQQQAPAPFDPNDLGDF